MKRDKMTYMELKANSWEAVPKHEPPFVARDIWKVIAATALALLLIVWAMHAANEVIYNTLNSSPYDIVD